MPRSKLSRVLLLLLSLAPASVAADGRRAWVSEPTKRPKLLRSKNRVPGRYIVALKPNKIGDLHQRAARLTRNLSGAVHLGHWEHLSAFGMQMSEAQATALAEEPEVDLVLEDGKDVHLSSTQTNPPWHLDRDDQARLPLDNYYGYESDGSGVTVYVLDSGIRATHKEFAGRVLAGHSVFWGGRATEDCSGHGTQVAGLIAGTTYGVAKRANLVPVQVTDCSGHGYTIALIEAMNWISRNVVKPAVINMSFGTDEPNSLIDDWVVWATRAGITVVAGAGNETADSCTVSPAGASLLSDSITVAASDQFDAWWPDSNFGACVNIIAPGSAVKSAYNTSDTATQVNSGTSLSAPQVAGAAARYLSAFPNATPVDVRAALINDATEGVLTGVPSNTPNRLLYVGPTPPPPLTYWIVPVVLGG